MADPKFVWPKDQPTSDEHVVKDPFIRVHGVAGIETYCGLWFAWGGFHPGRHGSRCIACLKGFMADNVVINGEPDRG